MGGSAALINPSYRLDGGRTAPNVSPDGAVRAEGHAVARAGSPAPLGLLFWGAWGCVRRPRLGATSPVGEAGIDYVRVLGSVGGPTWEVTR
jgi:hypothetical protein